MYALEEEIDIQVEGEFPVAQEPVCFAAIMER